jgi:hypothetical protein
MAKYLAQDVIRVVTITEQQKLLEAEEEDLVVKRNKLLVMDILLKDVPKCVKDPDDFYQTTFVRMNK